MKVKRILVIKGESRYNVLRIATDEVAKGFAEMGYDVEIADLLMENERCVAEKMLTEEYAFIFSCQALYFDKEYSNGAPFIQMIKSPYISWIFDDMLHHLHRVMHQMYDHTVLLSVDEEMQDIACRMLPEVKNMAGLIHGGFEGSGEYVEKDIDVLFPGTIGTEPALEKFIKEPMPIERMLAAETIKQIEVIPQLSVRKALELVLNRLGEELTGDLLVELSGVILYVDLYIRHRCRYRMMETLLKSGIHLHVVGSGENDLMTCYKDQITICGAKDVTEVVKLMQRSKIVMNPFPVIFYQGAHERIFTALLNKAVCFTPYSEYLDHLLGNRVQFIDMNDLQTMADDVKKVIETCDNEEMQKILENNYIYALENHTWKVRGREIAEFYESLYGM